MRLAAGREPAPDQSRTGKRSPDERSDVRGGVGVVPNVAALIRATCCKRWITLTLISPSYEILTPRPSFQ